jgi:ribonuclease HII
MEQMTSTEYILCTDKLVAGVDEVARGTFIGPVVCACVVLPASFESDKYKQIKDSKKLSPKKRSELAEYIKSICITYGLGTASVAEIDSMNILNATMKAMHRAVDDAYKKHAFDKILVDGPYFKGYVPAGHDAELVEHECIPKGDSSYLCIAAASIIAKDYHTKMIADLVNRHPILKTYDIHNNKGYGTLKHLTAIKQHGITEFHRKSFGICKTFQ